MIKTRQEECEIILKESHWPIEMLLVGDAAFFSLQRERERGVKLEQNFRCFTKKNNERTHDIFWLSICVSK